MSLQLRDNVHWCVCDGRAVFLDLEADRYFCLPTATNEAFKRLAADDLQSGDAERLQKLVARRILVEHCTSAAVRAPPVIEPPTCDWLTEPPRAGLFQTLQALLSEMVVARLLRKRPLLEVLDLAQRHGSDKSQARCDQDQLLHAIVSASSTVSYLLRVQDRCLVRALAVHFACRRVGVRPKLVFGVIAHPFAAHCWVQLRSAVLVGGFEQARLYTPILVLE